jgi:CSLREA domain-containing protein
MRKRAAFVARRLRAAAAPRRWRRPWAIGGILLVAGVAAAGAAEPRAATLSFTVNTAADAPDATPGDGRCLDSAGQCTLRAAVQESNAQPAGTNTDVILPAGTYALTLGVLAVAANQIEVDGAGSTTTIIESGKHKNGELISVAARSAVTLAAVELTGGRAGRKGGGALVNLGTATLNGVSVTQNASKSGGGLTNARGATLSLVGATVSNNSAGPGAVSAPGGSGGGIMNAGTLNVSGSTISGNRAGSGGFGQQSPGGTGGDGGGIANTGTVVVDSSTISDNAAGSGGVGLSGNEPSGAGGNGGGIYSSSNSVTLTSSVVSGNTAGSSGPAGEPPFPNAGDGGGVWRSAALHVAGTTFSSNAGETGTGVGGSGGAIFTSGSATVASSTFTSNVGGMGAGAGGSGGAIDNHGTLSLSQSTLVDNAAGSGGESASGGDGGALYSPEGSATLTGDTLNANTSGAGGNAYPVDPGCSTPGSGGDGGAIYSSAAVTVADATVSGNATGQGGFYVNPCAGQAPNGVGAGLAVAGGAAHVSYSTVSNNADGIDSLAGSTTLQGTIVADSTGPNCTGVVSEGAGFNLDSGTSCRFSAPSDITGTEPLLGPLASNGGPTATQALQAGSLAIDRGGTAADGCPTADQRGQLRPDEPGDHGVCDIGAYESQGLG